VLLVKSY